MGLATNTNRSLTPQLQADGLRLANLAHVAFRFHQKLAIVKKDGSLFTPRISWVHFSADPDTAHTRFCVLVVDPNALYHVSLAAFDSRVLQLLKMQMQNPVFRLSPETLVTLYGVRHDQAENMVAYLIDLLPQKRKLPDKVDLPDVLTADYLLAGTDGRQQIGGTAKELQSIMVAGESGSGKSTLLCSLAFQAGQHGWSIYLAEPETSHTWQRESWLRMPGVVNVQNDAQGILKMIGQIEVEVERRSALFSELARERDGIPPADIYEYNRITGENLKPILIGIDEYLDFRYALFADVLEEATRKYRKFGLVTLIAAHNWQAQSIPMSFASLLHTRICLKVNDPYIGQATLFRNWHYGKQAVELNGNGRGLTLVNGRMTEFQCYYLPDKRISAAMRPATSTSIVTPLPVSDGIDNKWPLVYEMVQWSMDEHRNGDRGKFAVRGVGAQFKEKISAAAFNTLAKTLEARGYLKRDASNSVRRITPELLKKIEALH